MADDRSVSERAGDAVDSVVDFIADIPDRVRDFIAGVPEDLRDLFADLEAWLASITVVEWVVAGIAVALAAWAYAMVRAASDLGPIVVEPVIGEDGNELPSLTSRLRRRINDVGLRPPPGVPSGAPAAHLLSAVRESPVPQANWIASLIEAMPRPSPMSYRLHTTFKATGEEFSYWLCPTGPGSPQLGRFDGTGTAVDQIAKAVLMHVSDDAVGIFPPWARWSDGRALEAYLEGLNATNGAGPNADDGEGAVAQSDSDARDAFSTAHTLQPDNALARLRWLNAREKVAAAACDRVVQAQVLRGYLDLVLDRPELFEARYRCSTLAGVVADAYREERAIRADVSKALGIENVERNLRRIEKLGLRQAGSVLRPWFVPIVWRRMRYATEPRGSERRRHLRTLRLSQHCRYARHYRPRPGAPFPGPRYLWHARLVKLQADRATAAWQVSYNAGCFFALAGHESEAYRFLARALDGGGLKELRHWMPMDPDLKSLKKSRLDELLKFTSRQPTASRAALRSFGSVLSVPVAATMLVALLAMTIAEPWLWAVAFGVAVLRMLWVVWRYFARAKKFSDIAIRRDEGFRRWFSRQVWRRVRLKLSRGARRATAP